MPCGLRTCIFVWILLGMAGALCCAQDFSADIASLKPGDHMGLTKMFVSGNKVRMEGEGMMAGGAAIYDLDQHKYYMLMPQRQMYVEFGQRMPLRTFAFWRPTDVNNACPEWKNLAEQLNTRNKIGTCRKVGNDTVNGRSAVEYEGTSTDGKKGRGWVDSKLRWLIKYADDQGGGMEFRNIQEGSQPSSLFEIPAGYQKMDMGGMMGHPMTPPPNQ
jgi:hypothetical protein